MLQVLFELLLLPHGYWDLVLMNAMLGTHIEHPGNIQHVRNDPLFYMWVLYQRIHYHIASRYM